MRSMALRIRLIVLAILVASGCSQYRAGGLLNEGNELAKEGKVDAAIEKFDRASSLAPDWWAPRYAKAHVLRDHKRYREATSEYRSVVGMRPDDCEAAFWLGRTLLDAGNAAEAVARLRPLVVDRCTEHKQWARLYLAIALESTQQTVPAVLEFRQVQKECPACLAQEPAASAAVLRLEAGGATIRQ
jgi:tetratricopeptide (TPR) repeat protein